jgi:hypothetical protein
MPKMVTKTIKEIFENNPKKEFTLFEISKKMDEEYAIPLDVKADSSHFTRLTRTGFLIRRKGENGKYLYRLRGK